MDDSLRHDTAEVRVFELERRLARLEAQVEELGRHGDDRWQSVLQRLLGLETRQISRGEVIGLFVLAAVLGHCSLIGMLAIASRVCGLRV